MNPNFVHCGTHVQNVCIQMLTKIFFSSDRKFCIFGPILDPRLQKNFCIQVDTNLVDSIPKFEPDWTFRERTVSWSVLLLGKI